MWINGAHTLLRPAGGCLLRPSGASPRREALRRQRHRRAGQGRRLVQQAALDLPPGSLYFAACVLE